MKQACFQVANKNIYKCQKFSGQPKLEKKEADILSAFGTKSFYYLGNTAYSK